MLTSDPAAAIAKARDSLRLNDERLQAYYLEAAAWARLGDYRRARAALAEAARREPHDFVTWALLGDLATRRGDDEQALTRLPSRACAQPPGPVSRPRVEPGSCAARRRFAAPLWVIALRAVCGAGVGGPAQVDLGPPG